MDTYIPNIVTQNTSVHRPMQVFNKKIPEGGEQSIGEYGFFIKANDSNSP